MNDITERKVVRFIQSWRGYAVGETAGFKPHIANELVEMRIAEFTEKEPKKVDKEKTKALKGRKGGVQEAAVNK